MKKTLILGDWLFNLDILKSGFDFLSKDFELNFSYKINKELLEKNWDIVIAWGSASLELLPLLDKINNNVTVLMSPYLDFERFFSWCENDPYYKKNYLAKSFVNNDKFLNKSADLSDLMQKKVFLSKPFDKKAIYIFVSGKDNLIKAEDVLKIEYFFKNSSIHYFEDIGFAPFYENPKIFQEVFKGFVIDENF